MSADDVESSRFEGHVFNGQYEWVVIHDTHAHPSIPQGLPCIWLCTNTLRVRANAEWTKLPKPMKRVMVAHEMGHREYQHYLKRFSMLFREVALIEGGVCPDEVQADAYAVKLTSKEDVLSALTEWKDKLSICALSKREFELRIEAVRTSAQVRRGAL